ncbi:MAG: dihydrolipoyl dehydrogenase [Candidatus Delongbacteria bacterium]|jgi:dihydrolipoamide dehydrogenase|nr:dihydrolipoyl dehydrogenase [Candidatus Delongbacteria bacterium]
MKYDLIVIGSGPGGYVAAIRASQLGMKTAVVEKAETGGVCLNWGCIPTKALIKSAQVYNYLKHAEDYGINTGDGISPDFTKIIERSRGVADKMSKGIQFLLKKNKIDLLKAYGRIAGKGKVEVTKEDETSDVLEAEHIIIATGAHSKELPGIKQDGKHIIGYREALTLETLPDSMVIVGSGAIGSEFAYIYNALGTKVTLVEFLPELVPNEDSDVSRQLKRSFKKSGIKVMTKTKVESVKPQHGKCHVTVETKKGKDELDADVVLSAVGFEPNLTGIGLEDAGIALEKGKIKVDDFYRTNVDGVYAIGDVVHGPALAHVASAEGIACVEKIAGKNPDLIDYNNIPSAVYTMPEISSVGLTEAMAKETGYEVKIGKFPLTASGKATAAGNNDGFVKLIFDASTGKLMGAHMMGENVTEMIAELVLAKKMGATGHQIIKSIHPHPTISEAVMEAAAAAYDEVIHI